LGGAIAKGIEMMKNQNVLTKSLAIVGTTLVWLPLAAPLIFSAALGIRAQVWHIDYLMPAELFLIALLGSGLLIWSTLRAHRYTRMIGGAFSLAVFLLFGGQALAVITGLASGAIEPTGLPWVLVLASIAGYILALGVTGVGGFLLIRHLFKTSQLPT
jgi:hypothetical protein